MLKQLLWIAMLSAWFGSVCAEPAKPIVVIESGKTYAKGTLPRQDNWFGLYCNGSDCEIRDATVSVKSSTAKNVLEEDEAIDVLYIDDGPLALFHGIALKHGKVVTWFKAEKPMHESRHYSQLRKLGRWQMPWGAAPLGISWVKLPEYGGFRYHISDGTVKQFMFATSLEGHYGGDTTPFIHWVGDVDGDGKIDLLLSFPDDNCGFDERLYLSSLAAGKEFVRKAAQLSGREAACGC